MKSLILKEGTEAMIPVAGVVAEFVSGVNELARLSPDGAYYRNDMGFNGVHASEYNKDKEFFQGAREIPLTILVKWINAMKTYKNRQNPYNRPYDSVVLDLRKVLSPFFKDLAPKDSGESKVVKLLDRPPQYGKYIVYITDGENVFPRNRKWIAHLSTWFDQNNIKQEPDNYGRYNYPTYKYFSKNKDSVDGTLYEIRPELFNMLADFFKQNYPDYKIELQKVTPSQSPSQKKQKLTLSFVKDDNVASIWRVDNNFGFKKIVTDLGIWGKGSLIQVPFQNNSRDWVNIIWHGKEQDIISKLDSDGTYDTSELKKYVEDKKASMASASQSANKFSFRLEKTDIYVNPLHRKSQDPQSHEMLGEMVKFGFPVWKTDRDYDKDSFSHVIKSKDLNSLFSFYSLLKKSGFEEDAKSLSDIINQMKREDLLNSVHIDGVLEEYKNDTDKFYRDVNDTTKINLYPKQLKGVRHLYSRKTSLLGDETGVGKTAQLIAAANLRLKHSGGKCLIITMKSVQSQWAQEIIKFIDADMGEISFDGTSPKKWTILYYENFQAGKQKEDIIETTRKTDYTVVAFDEVHKIKHEAAKRSENIHFATNHIPYKWGASATMAANKPFDIKNQLRMLGHRMGDVNDGWFKREFAGMVPEGYGGAYVEGGRDKQIEAAIQFRKWLANSGIYIRRSKKEIRSDMPSMERDTVDVTLSNSELQRLNSLISEKLSTVKDPDMALTKLLVARQAVATQKVPYTVKRATDIIKNGEKLVIFTSFIEPGRQIVKQLSDEIRRLNPDYKVGVYTSDSKDRVAEKERFMKDPMVKALVMSIKIGGTGVDFPNGVNHMIVNDFDWTPEQAEQSEGRIFRINSRDNKIVEYIIAENTIDSEIFDMVSQKREISEILQTDLTQAYENPEDKKTAAEIYDAMVKIKELDRKLVDVGYKVGSNKPKI